MEALHIIPKDPTTNIEESVMLRSKFDMAYSQLSTYLDKVKTTKNLVAYAEHEAAVTRLIYQGKSVKV